MSADSVAPVAPAPVTPAASPIVASPRSPLAFIPTNLTEAWRIAEMLGKARILPDALRAQPYDILVNIMTGSELGLSPMASIREIYVVKGKGYLSSLLKVALVKQAPECEYFRCVESTLKHAIFETKRRGEGITRFEYTIEDAVRAELVGLDAQGNIVGTKSKKPDAGKDNWEKNPKLMLRRRCAGELADEVYPEITRGCGTQDDLPDNGPLTVNVNAPPATFAPPPPEKLEDAQVSPPTPPPPPAKTDAPASPPRTSRIPFEDKSTDLFEKKATREPGADEDEELQTPLVDTTPDDAEARQVLSEVNGVDTNDAKAGDTLDLLSPRAKKVNGPLRQQITDALKAKREAIKKKAGK